MYDFLARRAAKKHKTSPWFRTISSWKQQHLALVTSQEGSRSFCYVITPKIAVTRAEKHPGHVHYARRVYARRFSMERENKAELMSRWREEQKKKKKAIKRAHYEKNRKELIKKVAVVFPGTVRYVCSELIQRGRGRNKVFQVAWDVHEDIIASL